MWQPDSRTGRMRKHRLENEGQETEEEPITVSAELEQPSYTLPSSALLPVEEEESGIEDDEDEEDNPIEFA